MKRIAATLAICTALMCFIAFPAGATNGTACTKDALLKNVLRFIVQTIQTQQPGADNGCQIQLPGCQQPTPMPEPEPTPMPEPEPTPTPLPEPEPTPMPEPEPTPEPEPAPQPSGDLQQLEARVVELVNEARAQYGLEPYSINYDLCQVARAKSMDMYTVGYFEHTSPTYGEPYEMVSQFGIAYRGCAENIAMGYRTAESVVQGWLNSPGHRANILSSYYTQMGVGYYSYGNYWTQLFIKP